MEATRRNEIIKLHDALLDRLGSQLLPTLSGACL
jgi:hypothetical protein